MLIVITLFFLIVTIVHCIHLFRHVQYKEIVIIIIIMTISLFYTYSDLFKWDVATPMQLIEKAYEPISEYIFNDLLKYQ